MNKDLTAPVATTIAVIIGITFLIQQGKQSTVSASASSSAVTAAPADAVSLGGTHSDASAHAPNMQSFGGYPVEATASESGNVELHFCIARRGN